MLALSLLPLLLAIPGFAIPSRRSQVPASALTLPPNQQQLVAPADDPTFVGTIFGFQNFTCSEKGAWTDPFDPTFTQQVQDKYGIPLSGQHYFAEVRGNGGPVTHQVFDFRNNGATAGNPDAIVFADATGDIPAPTGPSDVDWQEMTAVSGKFASKIFRVNTKSGERDVGDSCQPGYPDDIAKFTAQLCECPAPGGEMDPDMFAC
ncbi:hypothetical protein H4582DRAFT_1958683 [Lactarius indigo]|nr:hypothetical protein H4582DRAFT_1958683 [Lactarius indigo]